MGAYLSICGSEDVSLHGASPISCMLLGQAWEDDETVTDGLLSNAQNRVQVVNVETSTFLNCQETVSQSFQLERFHLFCIHSFRNSWPVMMVSTGGC